ncbi:MAG: MaoC/PaaZ C-terminal domain-containing protein [Marinobacter sp.]|nr:MaoC/PaaZ C-terminal domain-containing protein [Marinobacter sp.]
MSDTAIFRNQPPGLWSLYSKALLPKGKPSGGDINIPGLSARLIGVSTANTNLKRYQNVCGFGTQTTVPITWPHILAFPLHLKLLTDTAFPLPLLGLVHLRNHITQHRPIGAGESVDIAVRLEGQNNTSKGLEFDLVTEVWAAGRVVWEETSTNLFRQPDKSSKKSGGKPPELPRYPESTEISAPESIGRQYASVSGDRNPIHLHALTAKAFGFPRAIAHGMWSKARVLALLEQQGGWRPDEVSVSCQFKKPLFLPGTAQLNWQRAETSWDYQLLNASGAAPHLSGEIRWGN